MYLYFETVLVIEKLHLIELVVKDLKTPKLYWADIGILLQISGYREAMSGEIYENMVVAELYKWLKTAQKNSEVYFYRTRSGMELDILLETDCGIIGMEIKSRPSVYSNDTGALSEVARGLGKKWRGGLVVYGGNEIKKISEPNIWAVPSRRLFMS